VRVVPQDKSKGIAKYCSKKCYFVCVRNGTQTFRQVKRDTCFALSEWFADWNAQYCKAVAASEKERIENECEVCGSKHTKNAKVCGKACMYKWRGEKPCRFCGRNTKTALRGKTTCNQCRLKAAKESKRKAAKKRKKELGTWRKRCRRYGGKFNPLCKRKEIYERDNYRCHVCRRKVLAQYLQGHPRSPTVDHHPIPLSKGGDHDWHNVRCCCNECNWKKGDKWDGQMALPISFMN